MKRLRMFTGILAVALILLSPISRASAASAEEERSGIQSIDLMSNDTGISFGNSKRVRGLRFNFRDEGVEEVSGLNLTLWKPGENPDAVMKGLLLGIYGPSADELHFLSAGIFTVEAFSRISGIAVGGGAVICEGEINGISIGGLANVAGSMNGIALGGLANVAEGGVNGVTVGGLANVADGGVKGITLGGLANVAAGSVSGITLGGLANVAEGGMAGISLGGLANVAEGGVSGITLGGLANVAEGGMAGISVGGLANVAEGGMMGVSLGGLANVAEGGMTGISLGGLANVAEGDMKGISLGGLANVAEDGMTGISVGGLALVSQGSILGLNAGGLAVLSESSIAGITASLGGIDGRTTVAGITVGVLGAISVEDVKEQDFRYTGIKARNARWITAHGIDIDVEDELLGLAASGIRINARRIKGFASSLVVTADEMRGLGIGAVNYTSGLQVGLSIGIVNYTERLKGVQLGLVNIAKNKSKPFRVLPIMNACFK